jgi:imidazolonepropionase-like amidohydrolase
MSGPRTIAYVGATLIDGTGADPIDRAVLVATDGVISAVGPAATNRIPDGASVVELDGLTAMPGIVDCHVHLGGATDANYGNWVIESDTRQAIKSTRQMNTLMQHGITSIRDISRNGLQLKWVVNQGAIDGPRIVACGPGLSRTGGHGDAYHLPCCMVQSSHPWAMLADGGEELRKAVRTLIRMGSDAIKIWATGGGMWDKELETDQHYDLDELKMVVREAAMCNLPVLAHCESLAASKDALRAGVWTMEHGEELDEECLKMMVDRGVIQVPTLQLLLGPWFDEYPPPPREGLERYRGDTMVEKEKNRITDNFNAARAAGVRMAVGSDSFSDETMPYGESTLLEVHKMVGAGMPSMEALTAATLNGAKALRIDNQTGSLEVGKACDLTAWDGDPLSDVNVLARENLRLATRGQQVWVDHIDAAAAIHA